MIVWNALKMMNAVQASAGRLKGARNVFQKPVVRYDTRHVVCIVLDILTLKYLRTILPFTAIAYVIVNEEERPLMAPKFNETPKSRSLPL